jgi:hypothetical protein
MVMIFENLKKKVDGFANVVWWSTYQHILKRIGQPCFRTVLHGFLIDKLLTASKTVACKQVQNFRPPRSFDF